MWTRESPDVDSRKPAAAGPGAARRGARLGRAAPSRAKGGAGAPGGRSGRPAASAAVGRDAGAPAGRLVDAGGMSSGRAGRRPTPGRRRRTQTHCARHGAGRGGKAS